MLLSKSRVLEILIAGGLAVAGLTGPAFAAAYLKYEGIPGESADEKHKGWIEITSVGFPPTQPSANCQPTGPGTVTLVRTPDGSSAALMKLPGRRTPPTVTLHVVDAAGTTMAYELSNALITSVTPTSTGAAPLEQVTMTYRTIKLVGPPCTRG